MINGAYDEVQGFSSAPFFEEIQKVKWVTLTESAHMGMWDERDKFVEVVATFLQSKA